MASSGGKTGSGGANSGGTAGTAQPGGGGSSATGGGSATGGTSATGGISATGGSSSGPTGGVTSTGGSTGTGGTTSAAGGGTGGTGGCSCLGGATALPGTGGTGPASGGRAGADAGAGRDGAVPGTGGVGAGGQTGGSGGRSNADASPSTGGTGSGGSTAYNPCKASPCVILPLGDSITHGFGSTDDAGYRSALFKAIVTANQNVTFIGSLTNPTNALTVLNKPFPAHHEGHDGFSVSQITGYVPPAKAFTATPHIVLLHIGTNDVTSNADPTTTANQLDILVSDLVKAAPDALVLVAKIIPLFYTSTTYNNYVAKIPGIVSKHAANGEHVVMVDMTSFPSTDFGNGVHPSDQGYAYMANLWYDAIKDFLTK